MLKSALNLLKRNRKSSSLRVLMLADQPGWAVDRGVNNLIANMPFKCVKEYYAKIDSKNLVEISSSFDLIYYSNSDLSFHLSVLDQIKTPVILGIRSHRYSNYVKNIHEVIKKYNLKVQVLNDELGKEFQSYRVVPNGINADFFNHKPFVVGFAGVPDEYKGFPMIKQACEELGVTFKPAIGDIPFEEMKSYYESIDLLVSASVQEGFCNPVMECLAMNKPVITTDTSANKNLDVYKIERSVEGIKKGILKYYTAPMVKDYTWKNAGRKMFDYVYDIIIATQTSSQKKIELEKERERLIKSFYN